MRVLSSSAQWQTAHAVAGHSGQFCDMAPLSGTPRAAEPILPHSRSPVTPGTFATRFRWSRSVAHRAPQSLFYRTHGRPSLRGRLRPGFRWLGVGVRIMALSLHTEMKKIVIFCDCLRAFCENPIFMWKIRFFRVISLIFCVKRLASLLQCFHIYIPLHTYTYPCQDIAHGPPAIGWKVHCAQISWPRVNSSGFLKTSLYVAYLCCPTLAEGWKEASDIPSTCKSELLINVLIFYPACSSSRTNLMHKHSSCY